MKRSDPWLYVKDKYIPNTVATGIDHLRDFRLNKGLGFKIEERQALGIHGLLPPKVLSLEDQVEQCMLVCNSISEDLHKYVYLMQILDRNERMFHRMFQDYVDVLLPIVYTPTVGLACQKYSLIYTNPKGLFITLFDKGHVYEVLKNWPEDNVKAIVVCDGERILGLGDLGAQGMGIPVSKLILYSALGGLPPNQCLPILLDVGTNNQELLDDKFYIGIKRKRAEEELYDEIVEELMYAIVRRFGSHTLIQFEDIANKNSFRLLKKYQDTFCVFNDDIQGTAGVVLAGLVTACSVIKKRGGNKLSNNCFLFLGAGSANIGIAEIVVIAMKAEGLSEKEAKTRIFMTDSKGLIVKSRTDLNPEKAQYAQDYEAIKDFPVAVEKIKPSILIGAAGAGRLFTPEILKNMARLNNRPIIFALSNPTSKAECTAEEAYTYTEGRVLFASGSPFPPVIYDGKTYHTRQANNAYIFPGVALGVISARAIKVKEEMFYHAAKALSKLVTTEEVENGSLYPPMQQSRNIALRIATTIANQSFKEGIASLHPEPTDMREYIKNLQYDETYLPTVQVYPWHDNYKRSQ